jgi:hypothetical protein
MEGVVLFDQPGVRAYAFAERAPALGHFLRATHGVGAMVSLLSRRAPMMLHVRRWLGEVLRAPVPERSTTLLAGWFATTGGGLLFGPRLTGEPFRYDEVGSAPE